MTYKFKVLFVSDESILAFDNLLFLPEIQMVCHGPHRRLVQAECLRADNEQHLQSGGG
jgi:hypothetical protein